MLKSMTAYGRGEYESDNTRFLAEIRSLNHRYRDIILRIPRDLQVMEDELKSVVSRVIKRGRVEVSVQMEKSGEELAYKLELNTPLVKSYLTLFDQLSEQFGLDKEIGVGPFCQMKDVILVKGEELALETLKPGILQAVREALESVDQMRTQEGRAIESDFLKRLALLEGYVSDVQMRAPELTEAYRQKIREKLKAMLEDVAVDEGRVAQEVVLFSERSDVTEEIVRIRSHLDQFRQYLALDDVLGRRLDFLIQEINREVNTLSSKAGDSLISKTVVEMKAELEKLREQAQNVE